MTVEQQMKVFLKLVKQFRQFRQDSNKSQHSNKHQLISNNNHKNNIPYKNR